MSKSIPNEWLASTVGNACQIRNDFRLPISREERADVAGIYPYYGPTGELDRIDHYRLDGTFALIGEDGDHFLDVEKKPQTILVSGKFNVNNHAHVIESTAACGAEWFYNYFRHRSLKPYLTRQGAGRYKLNKAALQELTIILPPVQEQEAINALFREWDTAIEKNEQLIAAKLRRNQVLSNQLLFGHVRFRQGNTKATRSLHWFSAPNDWQVVEIGKVAREVSTLNENDDELPILSCTKHHGLVESLKYFDKKVFNHDTSKSKIVLHRQFAYATNHIEEGSIGYQDFVDAGLVSPIYTVFQSDAKKIDDGYFNKLHKTEKLRQIFSARTNSSVDRRGSLRWKDFARIYIPLPPLDEQREINAVLDDAKREIVLLQIEVKALKQQKRGLMQKLLTGQWRVKVAETEVSP